MTTADRIEASATEADETVRQGPSHFVGLEEAVSTVKPKLISLDVFDTLLLRGTEPERRRHSLAAKAFSTVLAASAIAVGPDEILSARLLATRAAMSLRYVLDGQEDVPLETLFSLLIDAIGLGQSWRETLLDIEIDIECRSLTLNAPLARFMRASRNKGIRVVMTSDTNLSSAALRRLLERMGASDCFDGVRTSSDYARTKRSGTLFQLIMEEERLAPQDIVHAGDDIVNDFGSPDRLGITAVHLPRRIDHRFVCRVRKGLSARRHGMR